MITHKKCLSKILSERKEALHFISSNFQFLDISDRVLAWSDLILLFHDEDGEIRDEAAYSFGLAYSHVRDKEQAWLDLTNLAQYVDPTEENIELIYSNCSLPGDFEEDFDDFCEDFQEEDLYSREILISTLGFIFSEVPNKRKAWSDLIRLAYHQSKFFSDSIGEALGSAFPYVSDKEQSWKDLISLSDSCIGNTYGTGAIALNMAVFYVPDKERAWLDLLQLLAHSATNIGETLAEIFEHIIDKERAWKNLIRFTQYKNDNVCEEAAYAINLSVSRFSNKDLAWTDLLQLAHHENDEVKNYAINGLGQIFHQVHNKDKAWQDLFELMHDEEPTICSRSSYLLNLAFPLVADKGQAWLDIHRLIYDENFYLRIHASYALGVNFALAPNKETAYSDLHVLTEDNCCEVREVVAHVLGQCFSQVPDKSQALMDLLKLAQDTEADVKLFANYSLGKMSIARASESENESIFKKDLEEAIGYFEKSSLLGLENKNPAKFCFSFYKSLYIMMFRERDANKEAMKCLDEAKDVIKGSKSRKQLLEVIENWSNALIEAQIYHELDLNVIKGDLDKYRQYCERAVMLLEISVKRAPIAAKVLRKGLPLIDKQIKNLLGEIEDGTKNFCRATRNTQIEQIGRLTYKHARGLSEYGPSFVDSILNRLIIDLRNAGNRLPKEASEIVKDQLKNIDNSDLFNKGMIISSILNSITLVLIAQEEQLSRQEDDIKYLKDLIIMQFDNINYNIFKIKLTSSDLKSSLCAMEKELIKLNSISKQLNNIGVDLNHLNDVTMPNFDELNLDIIRIIQEMEKNVLNLPQTKDTEKILHEIRNLKPSRGEMILDRLSDILSIVGFTLQLYQSNPIS